MELPVRTAFVDFDHDATIDAETLVNFRYVSKGGFALVFLADYQRRDGVVQPVAIKVLKPENHFKPPNYQKFLQEVAFHTSFAHRSIVQTLGFCSVPVSRLIGVVPAELLVPGYGGSGRKAKSPLEWFAERRLIKCWALVMEMMPDGNMFDQVQGAAAAAAAAAVAPAPGKASSKAALRKTAAAPPAAPARPQTAGSAVGGGGGLGSYSDAQALLWMIDVADAMTFLHSQQPLLIHRDLKLENILLRRETDGRIQAKLSDFGLMVAVDAAGQKLAPPQVLRAPGQCLQDVLASAPAPRRAAARSRSQAQLGAAKAPLQGGIQGHSQKCMRSHPAPPPPQPPQQQPSQQQQQPWLQQLGAGLGRRAWGQGDRALFPAREEVAGDGALRSQRSSWSWTARGNGRGPLRVAGGSSNVMGALSALGMPRPQPPVSPPPQQSPSQAQLQLQLDTAGKSGTGSSYRHGAPTAADGNVVAATMSPNPQESRTDPGADAGSCDGDGGGAGDGALRRVAGSMETSPEAGEAAAAAAGADTGAAGATQPGALSEGPYRMPSLSRLSATSHKQVKMDQLNELTRMGKGHRDFLPDLYQMNFNLTGQCGSVCYMAPEVARQLAYNQKADVFSFGCLLYEVLTRRLLSEGIADGDADAAMEYVARVAWSGWRPELPASMAKDLRLLITLCWHREPRLRPSFPTIAARLREALSKAAEPSVPVVLRLSDQPEAPQPQQPRLQQQPSVRRNQADLHQSTPPLLPPPLPQQQQEGLPQRQQQSESPQTLFRWPQLQVRQAVLQHTPPAGQHQQQQQDQQQQQQQQQQHYQQQPLVFVPSSGWTSGSIGRPGGSSPYGSGPFPAGSGACSGGVGTMQNQLQQQLQQLQLAQQQQHHQHQQKVAQEQQRQRQHDQQLQLQFEQINACARAACTIQRPLTCNGLGTILPQPSPGSGCDGGTATHSATTAVSASTTTLGLNPVTCRSSSPMLWSQQPRAPSATSLDAALAAAARTTAHTLPASDIVGFDTVSLPSAASPIGGRTSNGADAIRQTGVTRSEASTSASAKPFRSPRSSQVDVKGPPPEEGCMSLCSLM